MTTPIEYTQPVRPRRPIAPFIIVALTAAMIVWIQLADSIEGNFRAVYTIGMILLTIVLLGLWVLLFSGMRWGKRLGVFGAGILALVLIGVAMRFLTRREGSFTGAGMPRLVWRWTPVRTAPPLQIAPVTEIVDLSQTTPDDFPQFLGPQRDNQVRGVHLGRDWSSHPPQLLWRREVGTGWSGFSAVGNFALTMEQRGGQECTICYDIHTGQPLWQHENTAYLIEREGGDGPRATPTIDHGRVYTIGGLGNLDCLDGKTGKAIWSHSILTETGAEHLRYGQTSSPLIVDNKVIVTGGDAGKDHSPRAALLAFDKDTGAPPWQFVGDQASYASPALATLAGVRQIVCLHQNMVAGHDISDGHILWQFGWAPGFWPKNSQPVSVGNDRIYCSTGYGIGSLLLQIRATGSTLSATEIWHSPIMKTELSNVVYRDGFIYGLDDGRLTCQDISTGNKQWPGPRFGHGQILQAGDLLIAQTESGEISLLDANPTGVTELGHFTALTESKTCWNIPALAGHLLIVRNEREAACYRLP